MDTKWIETSRKGYKMTTRLDVSPKNGETFGAACERVSTEIGAKFWENMAGSNETDFYK
jgi:hypothetical protein